MINNGKSQGNFRNPAAFRQVCIKHDFCNCATNRQYEYIMHALNKGMPAKDIVFLIWFCTDGATQEEIRQAMREAGVLR